MDKKLNLKEKLDFSEIDLTAPDKVVSEFLNDLPEETNGIISGKIESYDGEVESYTRSGISSMTLCLGDTDVDIQNDLGNIGQETHKFECYIYTPQYEKYKYRIFFLKYGISNYPVDVILEESVAESVTGYDSKYIFTCNSRDELEKLIVKIFNSKKIISVMQELIRINQAKKLDQGRETITDEE